jgi:hypothetical protein
LIEPKGGELDYDLAYTNPIKFYNSVISQDVIQHKVSREKGEVEEDGSYVRNHSPSYSSKMTRRKIGRIYVLVEQLILDLLKSRYHDLDDSKLYKALKDSFIKHLL